MLKNDSAVYMEATTQLNNTIPVITNRRESMKIIHSISNDKYEECSPTNQKQ